MKRVILLLLLFSLIFVSAETANDKMIAEGIKDISNSAGEKLGDIGKNTNIYAEALGENLLKFQNFFMGALGFVSLGFLDGSKDTDFITFLFFILLFMMVYSIVGFVFKKFNFGIAFCITVLAFIGISKEALQSIFMGYGAMGITITVILPILILLAFTFRIYYRAYYGKGASPFYAEVFNFIFLIFFGVFFIRYSATEEGAISSIRFVSGLMLIGFGIAQTFFYKVLAEEIKKTIREKARFKKEIREMKEKAREEIIDEELKDN